MVTNDCGSGDLVISQDGCNVGGRWFAPLAGTVSGGALTLGAVDDSSLSCRAAVVGNSLAGGCTTAADVDGNRWECTFEASFSSE